MNDKVPYSLEDTLRILLKIKDAIQRSSFLEALDYTSEALADIANESEWSLHSDLELLELYNFLNTIYETITIAMASSSLSKTLKTAIIDEIDLLILSIPKLISNCTSYSKPDKHLDQLEIIQRKHKYSDETH